MEAIEFGVEKFKMAAHRGKESHQLLVSNARMSKAKNLVTPVGDTPSSKMWKQILHMWKLLAHANGTRLGQRIP